MKIIGKTKVIALALSAVLAVSVVGGVLAVGPGGGSGGSGATDAAGRPGHPRIHAAKALVTNAAATIGIDAKDLAKELKSGKTIAQVATEHTVSVQTVIDNAVAQANTAVDKALADGKITSEQATKIKSQLVERITKIVNEGRPQKGERHQPATTPAAVN